MSYNRNVPAPTTDFGAILGPSSIGSLKKSIQAICAVGLSISMSAAFADETLNSPNALAENIVYPDSAMAETRTMETTLVTATAPPTFNPRSLTGLAMMHWLSQQDMMRGRYDSTGYDTGGSKQFVQDHHEDPYQCGTEPATSPNPVAFRSGNKIRQENDFFAEGEMALGLTRYYSAGAQASAARGWFGRGWSSNLEHGLAVPQPGSGEDYVTLITDLGRRYHYERVPGSSPARYQVKGDRFSSIVRNAGFYTLIRADGLEMKFSESTRRIVEITNAYGIKWNYLYNESAQTITISRDSLHQIVVHFSGPLHQGHLVDWVTDAEGKRYDYEYTGFDKLQRVIYPGAGGDEREYVYGPTGPTALDYLTEIKIGGVPYQQYDYQDNGDYHWNHRGKVKSSELAGGAERMSFEYGGYHDPSLGTIEQTMATNVNGVTTTYSYRFVHSAVTQRSDMKLMRVDRAGFTGCGASQAYYAYDANGYYDYTIDFEGIKTDYTYDADGRVREKVEGIHPTQSPNGLKYTKFNWDDNKNRVTTVTEGEVDTAAGHVRKDINVTTFTYYANNVGYGAINRISSVTKQTSAGRNGTERTEYRYTRYGNGRVASMAVDGPDSGTADTDTFYFNLAGHLTSSVNAEGHTYTYTRNNRGQMRSVVDPNGKRTEYTYDDRGRPELVRVIADGKTINSNYEYDRFGNESKITTDGQPELGFEYDNVNRLRYKYVKYKHRTQADTYDASYENYQYNELSQPVSISRTKGTLWTPTCTPPPGGLCWVEPSYVSKFGAMVTLAYDEIGRLLSSSEMEFEPLPFSVGTADAKSGSFEAFPTVLGRTTSYTYDSIDRVETVTNHKQETTRILYDAIGRQTRVTRPDNRFTTTSYGFAASGARRVVITPPNGLAHTIELDGMGNTLKSISPDTGTTTFTHTTSGLLYQIDRADGSRQFLEYDKLRRVKSIHAPWPQYAQAVRGKDPAALERENRQAKMKSLMNAVAERAQGGAPKAKAGGLIAQSSEDDYERFTYDTCANGKGRLCETWHGGSRWRTHFAYNQFGAKTSQTESWSDGTSAETLSYGYDQYQRPLSVTYPSGTVVQYTYDADWDRLSRIRAVVNGQTRTIIDQIGFDDLMLPSTWTTGNGLDRSIVRDHNQRVSALQLSGFQDLQYEFDQVGRVDQIHNSYDFSASQTYTYDNLGRLTHSARSTIGDSWQHDFIGNRTYQTRGTRNYNHVLSGNRLDAISGSTVNRQFGYDPIGQRIKQWDFVSAVWNYLPTDYFYDPTQRQRWIARWHETGFVCETTDDTCPDRGAGVWEYGVNALGQRIYKTDNSVEFNPAMPGCDPLFDDGCVDIQQTRLHRYFYNEAAQLLSEREDYTGTRSDYIWFAGELVGIIRDGSTYYVASDHLSRPQVVVSHAGSSVWEARNLAFHREVSSPSSSFGDLNIGFPGQYYDKESGLWYNWHRYYDSSAGRYTQSDPIGLGGGVNTHTYALQNPVGFVDSDGLDAGVGPMAYGLRSPRSITFCEAMATLHFGANITPFIGLGKAIYEEKDTAWDWFSESATTSAAILEWLASREIRKADAMVLPTSNSWKPFEDSPKVFAADGGRVFAKLTGRALFVAGVAFELNEYNEALRSCQCSAQ